MPDDDYELLDLDRGRKLERFGEVVLDRPAPAARGPRRGRERWREAWAVYSRGKREGEGRWSIRRPLPDPWSVRSGGREFLLEASPSGQVGLFPEQAPLRRRVESLVRERGERADPVRVLDLFSYTGGNAMAAAAGGGRVTAVDGARGALARARRNLARNGLDADRLRTIVDHVPGFVHREIRRANRYEAILLDPPSFGRGPKGEVWKLERDLDSLLAACVALLADRPKLLLVTAHAPSIRVADLASRVDRHSAARPGVTASGRLTLVTTEGGMLPSGIFALKEFHA
jgi:23S rRNA (cytosine1962-C5)-methyltransferase